MQTTANRYLKKWAQLTRCANPSIFFRSGEKKGLQMKALTTHLKCMQLIKYHYSEVLSWWRDQIHLWPCVDCQGRRTGTTKSLMRGNGICSLTTCVEENKADMVLFHQEWKENRRNGIRKNTDACQSVLYSKARKVARMGYSYAARHQTEQVVLWLVTGTTESLSQFSVKYPTIPSKLENPE